MRLTLPLMLLSMAVSPAAAGAAWVPESVPSSDVLQINDFGFDSQGRGLLTYEGFRDGTAPRKFTAVVSRGPDGTWAGPSDVPGLAWGNARTHIFGGDLALLVATRKVASGKSNRAVPALQVAYGGSDGAFGRLRTLDRGGFNPVSDVNDRGDAVVAWSRRSGQIFLASRIAGGVFRKARRISPKSASSPAVAVNEKGDMVVAWVRKGTIYARLRRAARGWGDARRVVKPALRPSSVLAAMGPTGKTALVTYGAIRRSTADGGGPSDVEHGVAYYSGGRFRGGRLDSYTRPNYQGSPQAIPTFASGGRPLVAWVGSNVPVGSGAPATGSAFRLARVAAETFEIISSQAAPDVSIDDLAVSAKGALAATWSGPNGDSGPFVAVARDGANFAAATDLHEASSSTLAPSSVAFDAETPFAVWPAGAPGAVRPNIRAAREG